MKKFILSLIIVLNSLNAWAQSFKISLDINGIITDQISIYPFGNKDGANINYDNIDYKSINGKDGHFIINGTTQEHFVMRIIFNKDRHFLKSVGEGYFPYKCAYLWLIVSPNSDIHITGDLTGKKFVDIFYSGDPENALFAQLNSNIMPLFSEEGDIAVKMEVDKTLTETDKATLESRSKELGKQIAKVRENFINEHPSCIAALWLTEDMLIRSQVDMTTVESTLAKVDAKYKNTYFYTSLNNRIQGSKNAAIGFKCPAMKGVDQNGNPFDIANLRGKYVIIDFWGTWCGACLAGMPAMREFRNAHSDKVEILGVANDKDAQAWKDCIKTKKMDWINIMQGTGDNDYVAKFNVQGFPTKIFLGPDGTILYRSVGEKEEFYSELEKILNKR